MRLPTLCAAILCTSMATSAVHGQSIGVFADPEGTNCNLTAPTNVPVTWYVLYRPEAGDAAIRDAHVWMHPPISAGQYFTHLTPHPAAVGSSGNPFVDLGQLTFDCASNLTGPVILYTVTVINLGVETRVALTSRAFITRCDSNNGFNPEFLDSFVNYSPQFVPASSPVPANGAVDQPLVSHLDWTGSQESHPCLPYSVVADVYFGVDADPPFLARTTQTSQSLPLIAYETTYYWRIDTVVLPDDIHVPGPVWSFTTGGQPPLPPRCPVTCTDASECPSGCMYLSFDFFCIPESKAEHTAQASCPSPGGATTFGSMDRATGQVIATADYCFEGNGRVARVVAFDRFHIVGPPSPSPRSFTARLDCVGDGRSCIREANLEACDHGGATVSIPLQHAVNEEFVLEYTAEAFGDPFAIGYRSAILRFDGLPPGYSVVSCHGYSSPVGVTAASWSSVKTLYR